MHAANYQSLYAQFRSLPLGAARLLPGFWQNKQEINHQISLKEGFGKLQQHGNFTNLELVIRNAKGNYQGPQFMDSDIYKWLEAAAYELERSMDTELLRMVNDAISLLEKAQQPDGYLNSYWQAVKPGQQWTDLDTGHELYCAGHLIEAAIALHRTTREIRLLGIATRVADNILDTFGEGKHSGTGGHPEIELALVELYRETGEKRYLDMALQFINRRGMGLIGDRPFRFNSSYFQDRVPVREANVVEGHAVRQLYLTSGVTDIYMETGETALLDAMNRLWTDMTRYKMHITGGFGARHEGESFGDAFELPSDRCYCETCATIAAIMWNWRMLLATGEPRYADLIERCLYNGFISGLSLEGDKFFYVNPLQSRGGVERVEWFDCACCPPNVMRMISMIENFIATVDDEGIHIHQYASAEIHARPGKTYAVSLVMETGFPWDEKVKITVFNEKEGLAWPLYVRIPSWCGQAFLSVNDEQPEEICTPGEYLKIARNWQNGDTLELIFTMTPQIMEPDSRIDDIRGSLALEYGPFVYCIEETDHPEIDIDDVRIAPDAVVEPVWEDDLLGGIKTLHLPAKAVVRTEENTGLYVPVSDKKQEMKNTSLVAVPYYTWANRSPGKMRVWIPRI